MGKNEKTPITVNDKEYIIEDMNDTQKAYLNHVNDLGRKMDNARFNLDQLAIGREKFVELLADALENPAEVEEAQEVAAQ
jgi:enoyl reductase-like protein